MKRNFLFACYQTPRGKLLRDLECEYLQKSITVSCQQTILQIGGLGWENEFVDSTLYKYYTILDAKQLGCSDARKIQAKAYRLPLQCESVDMIIVPHLLEFDAFRFQTMREIERVLKPEGVFLALNFNPWCFWIRCQYLWDRHLADSWRGHFIGRSRILDWLKLLNFEVLQSSDFKLETVATQHGKYISNCNALGSTAYAIRAIKRRYNLIPLMPVANDAPRLVMANTMNRAVQAKQHD
jgi:SAM-dependent methyltransferase